MNYYHESLEHSKQRIDWWGAITLIISVVSLMFALELGGKQYAWKSAQIISLFVSFFVFFVAFFIAELKAEEPILPLWLFKRRLFAASQILAFLYGGTFIILTVFIPIFVQAVYGGSAKNSGLILTPMMLGSVAGSSIAGIFMAKTSYRNIMFVSFISYVAGMYLLGTMTVDTAHWLLTIYMILVGFGVGFSFSLLPTASIHNLEPQYRGTANSTNSFLRSFGMTLGVTIFGTIQGNLFADKLKEAFKGMQGGGNFKMGDPREIFQADQRSKIPSFILDKIVHAMSDSITHTFMLALIPIALIAITIFFMGKARVVTANKTGAKS